MRDRKRLAITADLCQTLRPKQTDDLQPVMEILPESAWRCIVGRPYLCSQAKWPKSGLLSSHFAMKHR